MNYILHILHIYLDPQYSIQAEYGNDFITKQIADKISNVTSKQQLGDILQEYNQFEECSAVKCYLLKHHISVWSDLYQVFYFHMNTRGCECPFIYFFIKLCHNNDLGVPKLALYDKMNTISSMQLCKDFIRCGNPICELNKLDQSTGEVKFKKCSKCLTVIYCSRECQVAHHPIHNYVCKRNIS